MKYLLLIGSLILSTASLAWSGLSVIKSPTQASGSQLITTAVAASPSKVSASTPTDNLGCALTPPVEGYSLWFDARDVDGDGDFDDQSDATAVATWVPKGIAGENVTQGTGSAKPTLDDDCVSADGPWCVYFDGGDHLAGTTAANWDFFNPSGDQSVFMLAKGTGTPQTGTIWGAGLDASGAQKGITISFRSTGPTFGMYGSTAASNGYINLNSYTNTMDQADMNYASYIIDRNVTATKYVNGVSETTDSSIIAGDGVAGPMEIGRQYLAGVVKTTVSVAQLLMYPSALSTEDRESVEAWLDCLAGN